MSCIIGVGTDIIEILRLEKSAFKHSFLEKCYTDKERHFLEQRKGKAYLNGIAGNFSVKESVVKALGLGFRGIAPTEIEVLRDEMGKPFVNLLGKACKIAEQKGVKNLHVSISHSNTHVISYVIAEG